MRLILLYGITLLMLACSNDDPNPVVVDDNPLEGLPDNGAIRFDHPEVGQRSRYVYFNASKDVITKEVAFNYQPDTLVLAITGKESDKWIVIEFMTKGSQNKAFEDEKLFRHFSVDSDSIYFTRPTNAYHFSWIFIGDNRTVPLQPVSDPAPFNADCTPTFGYESTIWMQYTTNYSQLGQTFHHLNDYFDYTEMSGDGFGFMYAYGPEYGLVRWTWVSAWEQDKAEGWDLIPN